MNEPAPIAKLKMIRGSLRCLVFGLLGLLPLIGPAFALAALWVSGRVRAREKIYWNPARPHRIAGFACAAFGALVWSGVDMLVIYRAICG